MARICALTLLFGVSCASAAHFSEVAGKFECPDIGNSYACAIAIESSLHAGFLHRTSRGHLDVKLLDGRVQSFLDVDADDATATYYNALETGVANRYVVIHLQFYEGGGYGLLDRKSGVFTTFNGYPAFSPDGRWLAVADGGEDDEGILRIFEVADGKFRLAFDANPAQWWPQQVQWRSPLRLSYERATLSAAPTFGVKTVKARAQLDGNAWR